VRLRGDPARLLGEVLPAFHAAAGELFADGRAWRLQVDTYVREMDRYGGPEGVAWMERWAHADSEAAAGVVAAVRGGGGEALRGRGLTAAAAPEAEG
jgi:lantibiotic biosynthesis protein